MSFEPYTVKLSTIEGVPVEDCGTVIEITFSPSKYEKSEEDGPYCIDFEVAEVAPFTTQNDFKGFIKWDGCMQWIVEDSNSYQFHFDGRDDCVKFFKMVNDCIWDNAAKLMAAHWYGDK